MTEIIAPVKKRTFKQRKWFDEYIKTGNATEAAMAAYGCKTREVAATIGYENIRKLDFNDIMDGVGLTDQKLISKVNQKLEAKDPREVNGKWGMVDNHQVQLKATELAFKLKGRLKDNVELTGKDGGAVSIELVVGEAFRPKDGKVIDGEIITNKTNDPSTEPSRDAQVATGGYIGRPTQV